MKTFVPGAIASAADVNANFNELAARWQITTAQVVMNSLWSILAPTGQVQTVGPIHTLDLYCKRTGPDAPVTNDQNIPLCTIPAGVALPSYWAQIGTIHGMGVSLRLVLAGDLREVRAIVDMPFTVKNNWAMAGRAVWFA